jgi:hypothetical protein
MHHAIGERRRWEYNIKMDIRKRGCENVKCFELIRDRVG